MRYVITGFVSDESLYRTPYATQKHAVLIQLSSRVAAIALARQGFNVTDQLTGETL